MKNFTKVFIILITLSSTLFAQSNHRSKVSGLQLMQNLMHAGNTAKSAANERAETTYIPLYDSILDWNWNTASWLQQAYQKIANFTYDAHHNLTSLVVQDWNANAWVNYVKDSYTYDAYNNITSFLQQEWNGSSYINYGKYIYTYDVHNNQLTALEQGWDTTTYSFVNAQETINTYDGSNNKTSSMQEIWLVSTPDTIQQDLYTYDGHHNMLTHINEFYNTPTWTPNSKETWTYDAYYKATTYLYQNWNGTSYDNNDQALYTYDGNHNLLTENDQEWNGTSYDNYALYTNTYTGNNKTTELYQTWNGTSYDNSFKDFYTYNAGDSVIIETDQTWGGASFYTSYTSRRKFDVNNILQSSAYNDFDSTGLALDGDSGYAYFHDVTGVNALTKEPGINIYPNPAASVINVAMPQTPAGPVIIQVYDAIGRQVSAEEMLSADPALRQFNITSLQRGLYFLQARSENSNDVFSFVKE